MSATIRDRRAQHSEYAIGAGAAIPLYDTVNRLALFSHNSDGSHKGFYTVSTGTDPDGVAFPTLQEIIDNSLVSTNTTLLITDVQTLAGGTTISHPIKLVKGGYLNCASGTVTINGSFEAGLYSVFTGAGSFTFGSGAVESAHPHWFGADYAAAQKAIAAYSVVDFCEFTITAPITVATPTHIKGKKVTQSTLNANAFVVTSSNVTFEGIEIVGNNGTHTPTDTTATSPTSTQYCGIYAAGSLATKIDHLKILNCNISGFDFAIWATYNHMFELSSSIISDCYVGCAGGTFVDDPLHYNDTSLSYIITNNTITCEYGTRIYSRPVWITKCGGAIQVANNKLRGGGMSIENTLPSATVTNDKRQIFIGNDCDTSISGGDIIANNVIDASLAPAGRGPQYGTGVAAGSEFYQAIEPGSRDCIIMGNQVRNYISGVGFLSTYGQMVSNNVFYHIGYDGTGLGACIAFSNSVTSNTVCGAIISGNIFQDINTYVVSIQWQASHSYMMSDIIIDSNIIRGSNSHGIMVKNATDIKVTNNIAIDLNATNNHASLSFFAWESGANTSVYYCGNTIKNSLGATYGTKYGVANQTKSVFGYNLAEMLMTYNPVTYYASPRVDDTSVSKSYIRDSSGSPSGVLTPTYAGELVRDSGTGNYYIGYNTVSNTQWKIIT